MNLFIDKIQCIFAHLIFVCTFIRESLSLKDDIFECNGDNHSRLLTTPVEEDDYYDDSDEFYDDEYYVDEDSKSMFNYFGFFKMK